MTKSEASKWYAKTSKRIRQGDDSPETIAENRKAEAAYNLFLPKQQPVGENWWNLPIAKACWEGDARALGA